MHSVSVAMATYNGARFLRRQLDSLALQAQLPAELVITDDGSADATLATAEQFASSAPFPVRIFRNPTRLGYRANFMRAAGLCTSSLVAFCDQDDRWHPGKIEASSKPFSDPEVMLVYHDAEIITSAGDKISLLSDRMGKQGEDFSALVDPWFFSLGFTQVFRRSLLAFDHLWPASLDHSVAGERMAHDQWYFFLASILGKVRYLETPLVGYRQHESNAFGWEQSSGGKPSLLRKAFRAVSRDYGPRYQNYARAARARERILKRLSADLGGAAHEKATLVADRYGDLATLMEARALLYTGSPLKDRMSALSRLIRNRGYRKRQDGWGFQPSALAQDVVLGALSPRSLGAAIRRRQSGKARPGAGKGVQGKL